MSLTVSMSYLKDQEFEFTNNSNNSLIVDMYDENLKKIIHLWNFYYQH